MMPERVRWTEARLGPHPRSVLLEFWHSPDFEPVEAVVDEQPDSIGLVLNVAQRPESQWVRHSLERHVAEVLLPFAPRGRPFRDVEPRRPPGIRAAARHHFDPDE